MTKAYSQFFNNLQKSKILIVGDIMLDRYWFSQVSRISPEAPVPIAKIEGKDERLGGAANVAANITTLQGIAGLISIIGNDEGGNIIKELLQNNNITPYLIQDQDYLTTVKLRVISRNQQLMRLDFETIPSDSTLSKKLTILKQEISNYQLLILSDYGKGGLGQIAKIISFANKLNIPILIDPKGSDYSKYKNSKLITPNTNELRSVIGSWQNEQELNTKVQNLREQLNIQAILLTRSEHGISLFTQESINSIPALTREVYDVSGAGDTVIALMGLAISSGCSLTEAMEIANAAASVVVGKLGASTVTITELKKALI